MNDGESDETCGVVSSLRLAGKNRKKIKQKQTPKAIRAKVYEARGEPTMKNLRTPNGRRGATKQLQATYSVIPERNSWS